MCSRRIGGRRFGLGFLEAGVLSGRRRGVGGGDVPFMCVVSEMVVMRQAWFVMSL